MINYDTALYKDVREQLIRAGVSYRKISNIMDKVGTRGRMGLLTVLAAAGSLCNSPETRGHARLAGKKFMDLVFTHFPADDIELWCGGLETGAYPVREREHMCVPASCAGLVLGAWSACAVNTIYGVSSYSTGQWQFNVRKAFVAAASPQVLVRSLPLVNVRHIAKVIDGSTWADACDSTFAQFNVYTKAQLVEFIRLATFNYYSVKHLLVSNAMLVFADDPTFALIALLAIGDATHTQAKLWLQQSSEALHTCDTAHITIMEHLDGQFGRHNNRVWGSRNSSTLPAMCKLVPPHVRAHLRTSLLHYARTLDDSKAVNPEYYSSGEKLAVLKHAADVCGDSAQ